MGKAKSSRSHPLLDSLNPVQKQAVQKVDGPILILAGAGSGKTRVLTHKVAYLIECCGVNPAQILAVTFTNKAAREMKERIMNLLHGQGQECWIGTFHSICARILRMYGEQLGYSRNFVIFDKEDQIRFIKNVMTDLNIPQKQYAPESIQAHIRGAKNEFVSPDEYLKIAKEPTERTAAEVYAQYQRLLKENNSMDFDDLLMNPILLFEQNSQLLASFQNKFKYILVDEFQDTNRAQYVFLKMLSAKHKNICVVGDDDQSIYRWRGADIRNILNLEKDFPNCAVFHLEQNYRSTKRILSAANSVVQNNSSRRKKTLWTDKEMGEKVMVLEVDDANQESIYTVDHIKEDLSKNARNFTDFAILYRTNAQSRVLEDALRTVGIPYVIVGGIKFYERKEVKDVMAYLRLICNPKDSISFKRVINYPLRGIGTSSITKLEVFAHEKAINLLDAAGRAKEIAAISAHIQVSILEFHTLINKYAALLTELSAGELARALVDEIGILKQFKELATEEAFSRAENVRELLYAVDTFTKNKPQSGLSEFLEEVALISDIDNWDDKSNAVTLMTLHSAKGLEFPVVFITGLEEGLFPLSRSFYTEEDLEEERRLFYVGATRAKEKLFLSWAARRSRFGESFENQPSRFLKEIDERFIIRKNFRRSMRKSFHQPIMENGPIYEETIQEPDQLTVGDEVKHALFGIGKVLQVQGYGENMKITVNFYDEGIKKLVVKYANLEKIDY